LYPEQATGSSGGERLLCFSPPPKTVEVSQAPELTPLDAAFSAQELWPAPWEGLAAGLGEN